MSAALKKLGFQVIEGFDLGKVAFDAMVRDFGIALKATEVGLFFYAGHGMQVSGHNYLVPVDAKLTTVSALDIEMVRLELVLQTMEREAKTNLLFFDACRNNPLAYTLAGVMANLVREDDTAVYGDKGYASDTKKRAAQAAGVLWGVKERAKPGRDLTKRQRARNHRFGKVRAKVEHVFRVLKCQFGYRKVRYRGLVKNSAQVFSLLALANLYLARSRLASA